MRIFKHKSFVKVFRRELHTIARSRSLLFATIIGPLMGFFLVVWIFSANVPRDLPVAVVDMDHTSLSRQIARMTDATPIAAIYRDFTSLEEAKKAMERGDADAVLYIPERTEKNILKGIGSEVDLYVNNTNVVKGGLLSSGIRKAIGTLSAGIKLQGQYRNGYYGEQAMARIMPVQLRSEVLFNPYISYSYFLTACLLPIILIVFTLLGTIYSLGGELYKGNGPQLLKNADNSIIVALAGKILPYTMLYFALALFMNVILFNYLGMPIKGSLAVIILGELMLIFSYQMLAIFFLGLFSNMRLSMSIASAYSMLAVTFSGLSFPVFGMPAFGQAFSAVFPFSYWLRILISQSLRGEPTVNGIIPMIALIAFILLGVLFIPRLKCMLLNEKRWGKI